jgi:hypothetical protein
MAGKFQVKRAPFTLDLMEVLSPAREFSTDMPENLHVFAEILLQDDAFMSATTFRQQIGYIGIILRDGLQRPVSYQKIADMFGVAKTTVMSHAHNFKIKGNAPGQVGRPSLLTAAQKNALADLIVDSWQAGKPLRLLEVKNFMINAWGLVFD